MSHKQIVIPIVAQAATPPARSPKPFRDAIEAFFVRHRERLVWVHAAAFVAFVLIIVLPLFLDEAPETATPLTHFTTFANYVMWGLWFPLVFLSVIFTGRSWCGLFCPMGAASEWLNKIGPQKRIPAWLRWEGTPAVSFVITTVLGQTVGVRDHPEAAAEIFGGTLLAALVIGYLFGRKKRAWCRHLCPIGRLLGLYSRLGAVEFAPQVRRPGRDAYSQKGACPTMIDLVGKNESRHCIECFRCVNPEAKGSVRMEFRRPGVEVENIRDNRANPAEAWFLFLDTGVALGAFLWLVLPSYQHLRQWAGATALEHGWNWLLDVGPSWLVSVHPQRGEVFLWLDFFTISGFMIAWMVGLTTLLATTTGLAAALSGRVGGDGSFGRRFTELGYQYAPVAMVSLVIGLGAMLFDPIRETALGTAGVQAVKGMLFVVGAAWSVWLSQKILARQGVPAHWRWLPVLPGLAGCTIIGACWWPAIFGA
ncbi:4Fe-4S binding protein [Propionivibrio dicarboxylicus]|uniref:Polyferredoxin n=1 Tax=Propionivibrio dicarboxylicus TaxID=83767 RepID=A0A1G7UXT9_9RHOO|nr:4Fe-4S binding protein [Propionivibrio dicarboxylicus]SDG52284.1 Polyferredoxin [Propionivibrio dicarboxylicus]